jgi:hypothetical protein
MVEHRFGCTFLQTNTPITLVAVPLPPLKLKPDLELPWTTSSTGQTLVEPDTSEAKEEPFTRENAMPLKCGRDAYASLEGEKRNLHSVLLVET